MPQYTIQTEHTSIFGMDVHARSVVVKGFDWSTGKEKSRRFGDCPSAAEIAEWMRAEFAPTYYAAYESGYTGFQLCRDLRALGIDCDVVAVSTIARSDDDRKRKTDRKDASRLLSEMLSPKKGKFSVVWVPDEECEAVRDLVRARDDAVEALKRSKQQTTAVLTRHDRTWNERTPTGNLKSMWTKAFMAWAKKADLDQESANRALALYIEWVERNAERVEEVSKATLAVSLQPRWKPYVDALCLLKGIDRQTALLLAAEIGDFSRFANGGRSRSGSGPSPPRTPATSTSRTEGSPRTVTPTAAAPSSRACSACRACAAAPRSPPRGARSRRRSPHTAARRTSASRSATTAWSTSRRSARTRPRSPWLAR